MMDHDSITRRAEMARRKTVLEQKALLQAGMYAWKSHNNAHTDIKTGHIEDFFVTDDFLWIEEHGDAWISVRIEWIQEIEMEHAPECQCATSDPVVTTRYATYAFMNRNKDFADFDGVIHGFSDEPAHNFPKEMSGIRFQTTLQEVMSAYSEDKELSHDDRQEAQNG